MAFETTRVKLPPMRNVLRFVRSKWVRIGLAITAAYHFVWGLPISASFPLPPNHEVALGSVSSKDLFDYRTYTSADHCQV